MAFTGVTDASFIVLRSHLQSDMERLKEMIESADVNVLSVTHIGENKMLVVFTPII